MEFNKYKERGAYHWAEYEAQTIYGQHADKVKAWIRKGKTLDIGAGDGLITSLLGAEGIDDNELAVKLAKEKKADVRLGDAYNLKYPAKTFDNVLMADVIEHLEFPEKTIKEIKRILKLDGKLYVITPPKKDDGTLHDKYHYKEYTPDELKTFVEGFGFKLDEEIIIKKEFVRMYAIFSNS